MPKKIDKQKKHLDKLAAENLRQDREPEPSDSSVPTVVPPHLPLFPDASKEEILCEFTNFLRNLPPMIDKEKIKIVNTVKSLLNIDKIIAHLDELDFEKLIHVGKGSLILGEHL